MKYIYWVMAVICFTISIVYTLKGEQEVSFNLNMYGWTMMIMHGLTTIQERLK